MKSKFSLLLFVLIIVCWIILNPLFAIVKKITIVGNKNITEDEIVQTSELLGNLVFFYNKNSFKKKLKENIMIKNIHYEKNYKPHEWLITEVYNKETYNTFLSETTQMFQNVIYIMTMNTNISEINKIDKSYLRNGRIDKIFNL